MDQIAEPKDFVPAVNGKPPATGPQMQKRLAWIELPDEYQGFKIQIWVNAPSKHWTQITNGDEAEALGGLKKVVLAHNGWIDFDGEPYPAANTESFWEEIPTELAAAIIVAAQLEMQKLPNSMVPRRKKSRRG